MKKTSEQKDNINSKTKSDGYGGVGEMASVTVPAIAENLKLIRRVMESASANCGFGKDATQDIVLAVDEACQNVIRHAYGGMNGGDIIVNISRNENSLVIEIRDFAQKVDVEKIRPRSLEEVRPGGLGTHFINEVMDSVEYKAPEDAQENNKGNILVLTKSLK